MILVAGLLAFTSVWGQNTTSGWEDESGKIPVKAYFESGKLHFVQSPNQKIPDRKTKCVIKTHINIKQNVIFGAKLKPV